MRSFMEISPSRESNFGSGRTVWNWLQWNWVDGCKPATGGGLSHSLCDMNSRACPFASWLGATPHLTGAGKLRWCVWRSKLDLQRRNEGAERCRMRARNNELHRTDGGGGQPGNYDSDGDLRQCPICRHPLDRKSTRLN